jgi:amino acid adenylation domain-containing protein
MSTPGARDELPKETAMSYGNNDTAQLVELGGVEAVLREQAGVRQAVVLAREGVSGGKGVVAYVVVDQQQPSAVSQLRRQLTASLPDHTAPLTFVLLDELPLTPEGMVDRQALPAPRDGATEVAPLSFAQQRLWLQEQLVPHSTVYNIPTAVRLQGALNVEALHQAMDTVVARHAVLRTTVAVADGQPVQAVAPARAVPLPVVDLGAAPAPEREAHALRLAAAEARRPFALARDWPLRATLLRLAAAEHVLLVTLHHIAADGWSVGLLLQELAALYAAFAAGRPAAKAELPLQYADYALWQRQRLQGEGLAAPLAYWKRQLAGPLPVLRLPTDHPRPPAQSFQGARRSIELPQTLSEALKALSRQEGVTLSMMLLAAFQILLQRHTDQDDIIIGFPVAGRNQPEIEGLIGLFGNTLVLRTDLSGDPSFRELLRRVHRTVLGAYGHQDLPIEKLVEELQLEHDSGRNPLFDVMLNFSDRPWSSSAFSGLTIRPLELPEPIAACAMTLHVTEPQNSIRLQLVYQRALFSAERMTCLLQQFRHLLEQVVVSPESLIRSYSLVTDESRPLLPDPSAALDEPRQELVADLFAYWVGKAPAQPAVAQGGRAWTYGVLAERADALARALCAQGLGRGDVVAVHGERSFGLVVSVLGVLLSGGVLLPIDRQHPVHRKQLMLREAAAKYLVSIGGRWPETLWLDEGIAPRILHVDAAQGGFVAPATHSDLEAVTLPEITPNDAAYIFFTSGTSAVPKGVLGCHKGLSHFLKWQRETFAIGPQDRVAQLINLSFDPVLRDFFLPLTSGATLCLPEDSDSLGPDELVRWLERERISVLHAVPSLAEFWLLNAPAGVSLPAMRWVFFSGECLTDSLVHRWRAAFPSGGEIVNLYGPTETTLVKCFYRVPSDVLPGIQPAGRPLPQTQALILSGNGRLCGIGEPGEIVLRTPFRSLGYLNAPEEQRKRFVKNPFRHDEQDWLYYTGDRGCYRPDGTLDIVGRLDDQVKIRGVRIEPDEVAAALAQHPAVRSCFVAARQDRQGQTSLVAYVVASEQDYPTIPRLKSYLNKRLPTVMVPAHFVLMDRLPLLPNGKIDRRALPPPHQARPELEKAYTAPRTELERFLTNIWRETLGIEDVGVHDNFFELGGNSLQGAVIINKLQKTMGEIIYVVALFDAPSIAEFAAYLNEHYPNTVAKISKTDSPRSIEPPKDQIEKVDSLKVTQIRQLIRPLPLRQERDGSSPSKNPPAIFSLSPPRSGSTLFRVMLAGHPLLFAPQELELLSFNTLEERKTTLSGRQSFRLEGTIRAVMEIKGCDAEQAKSIMEDCENQQLTAQQFYRLLQTWIGERILVDKTPSYTLDVEILKRAEADFDNARYIHLIRHPYAVIHSFEEAKLDQVFFRYKHPFSARELAELIWLISHQNILGFLKYIPHSRQYRVKFEDLVKQPRAVLEGICQFLGLEFHPDMLRPYKDQERKMTDGIYDVSKMLGDAKFHEHQNIDSGVADRWEKHYTEDFLGDVTWQVAESLGYENLTGSGAARQDHGAVSTRKGFTFIQPVPREPGRELPLSFAQQRLWFLDQLEPNSPIYNIPRAIRMQGALDVAALQKTLNAIVARHEVLRTTFAVKDESPVQVIAEHRSVALPVTDLSIYPEPEREAHALRLAAAEARRHFDLARDILLRASLLRLEAAEHVLLVTLHHIAADGWSMGLLLQELAALYAAYADGRPVPLPELPIQYADYALWQRQWLHGGVLAAQLAYWKRQLAAPLPALRLPTDRPRPPVLTFRGAREPLLLPHPLTEALRALSRREGVTLFMTLLAAFQTLLHRYTGQDDIIVGSPIAGRTQAETEGLIGFFVNTLVLRTDMSGNPNFRELLGRVRKITSGAYAHQDLPFERLVEELQPERDLSRSPLVQVMLILQNAARQTLELPGLTLTPLEVDSGTAKFDLTLSMIEEDKGLRGWLEYNTDLFEAVTIRRLLGHFHSLLAGILTDPEQRLAELPLLTESERQQLLVAWNASAAEYPKEQCLPQLFEAQVEDTPDATAVVFEGQQLTYRELNVRANQLAHHLKKLGVGPEALVAICIERSVEMVVGLLGILKAGGAYVPLDPAYPMERLVFMLEDAQASVLLTQKRLLASLPEHNAHVICLDADWEAMPQEPRENPASTVTTGNPAYVLYTSGSTGQPKGVVIPHQGLVNYLGWCTKAYAVAEGSGAPVHSPLGFDLTITSLFSPLLVGQSVVLLPEGWGVEPLGTLLRTGDDFSLVKITPAHLEVLSQGLPAAAAAGRTRSFIIGGEALRGESLTFWRTHAPDTRLINEYGPTETVVGCCIYEVLAGASVSGAVPIGRPIANTQLYILDSLLQPVPIGIPGELHIGGDGLARGYLNRPELTAEKFIPNPFSPEPGARLYKTGDLARHRSDGNLEFLGRLDHQVKLRGFRIELGEIEAVLGGHPAVREAVVVVREDVPGDMRLVAYVVPDQEPAPTSREWRAFLQAKLPDYMIPSAFIRLDILPLTPNGKVDRRALPAPDQARPALEDAFVAPRTPVEEGLARIWSQVLGLEQVGVHDNFFELGGHSLLATRVISRLRDTFHVELPLRSLFEAPTVAGLALTVARRQAEQAQEKSLTHLLAELETLSDEAVQRFLTDENKA